MQSGTYSMSTESGGDGFAVVTVSNKGTRGWAFSYLADDPESDYSIYEVAASLEWDDGVDPQEAGADEARWDSPKPPTDRVNERLKETYCLALYSPTRGDVEVFGDRNDADPMGIMLRALKRSENLL